MDKILYYSFAWGVTRYEWIRLYIIALPGERRGKYG